MSSFALWNNKGGVGKSFLAFSSACEYALEHPDEEVLVLDLCPQANLTEMLLGGNESTAGVLTDFYAQSPRRSVGGYFESRLTSPFIPLANIEPFLCRPGEINRNLPDNLFLLPGDNLLELLSEAIRQASQMALPADAWKKVMGWLGDFVRAFGDQSDASDVAIFVDCNPSFFLGDPATGSVVLTLLPVLIPAFAAVWILRILGRLLSENLKISQDAHERETLVKTFLALMRDDTTGKSVVTDDDRTLILHALF